MEQIDPLTRGIEVFGNYMLLEKFAIGGMAEVFLARPAVREGNGRLLVIKRILPQIANQHEFLNMFQREIQIIMGFTHANVVQLYDFGAVNGQPYIAMEHIDGKSLRDVGARLHTLGRMIPIPTALSLVAQAASGLHYAHTFVHKANGTPLNTIHRDVSPHNLIVSYEGNLKVIDFGIAKAACSVVDLSRAGTIKGKAAYFSPEHLEGINLDSRSDIFSLGVVAWELFTGQMLFAKSGDSEVSIMKKVIHSDQHVIPPSQVRKDIPPEIDRLILTALEKNRTKRFRDAREFQMELRKYLLKYYPDYTYSDTGEFIKSLFGDETVRQREHRKAINQRAQEMLDGSVNENTAVINLEDGIEEAVSRRMAVLKKTLKQKATKRHYLMLAIYIVSIVALKFGALKSIWMDYWTSESSAPVASVSRSRSVAKSAAAARPWTNRMRKVR
jgi:serine/threonine protein kinase